MLIVCSQTGTVLDADTCWLLNPDNLSPQGREAWEEADGNDSATSSIARQYGVPVSSWVDEMNDLSHLADAYKQLSDATRKELAERSIRSGDLTWQNCIPYSPTALREVLANMIDENDIDETSDGYKAVYYGAKFASDEWLSNVGAMALESSETWVCFKPSIISAVSELYDKQGKQEKQV